METEEGKKVWSGALAAAAEACFHFFREKLHIYTPKPQIHCVCRWLMVHREHSSWCPTMEARNFADVVLVFMRECVCTQSRWRGLQQKQKQYGTRGGSLRKREACEWLFALIKLRHFCRAAQKVWQTSDVEKSAPSFINFFSSLVCLSVLQQQLRTWEKSRLFNSAQSLINESLVGCVPTHPVKRGDRRTFVFKNVLKFLSVFVLFLSILNKMPQVQEAVARCECSCWAFLSNCFGHLSQTQSIFCIKSLSRKCIWQQSTTNDAKFELSFRYSWSKWMCNLTPKSARNLNFDFWFPKFCRRLLMFFVFLVASRSINHLAARAWWKKFAVRVAKNSKKQKYRRWFFIAKWVAPKNCLGCFSPTKWLVYLWWAAEIEPRIGKWVENWRHFPSYYPNS